MSSSTKTTNYNLSQFQNSDVPAWLTDYNGDMQKIDAGIHAAKVQADSAASGVSSLQTAMSGKQDTLTFDTEPRSGSTNPVTSGGIYNALQNAQVETDAVPTAGSSKPVQSGGVYSALQGKQNTLTFDATPTAGSSNPVTSAGIYSALQNAGAVTFNAFGNFKNNVGTNYPRFRYMYNPANHLFTAFLYDMMLTITGAQWVTASDSTFPSVQKLFYIEGNPFGLPVNASFPVTRTEITNLDDRHIGGWNFKNSDGNESGIYFNIMYASDENRTYIYAQTNYPTSENYNCRGLILMGDLNYD